MNRIARMLSITALAALAAAAQAQINNNPPGGSGPGGGRGPGIEGSVVTAARSPEVNADNTITFRLQAPYAKRVQVFTDMPKLGDVPVNGSAGFEMTMDASGVWSFTTPKLAPSYYQYWFVVDGLSTPDPQNTFVRPASGVYKSMVALPGKEADFMMFRDVPHGNLIEHHYFNKEIKVARRVVVYTPPDYNTSGKKYPVVYLLHGLNDFERGWTQSGMANNIMDNLLAEKKAVPAIIVMPFGHATTGATGKQPEILALAEIAGLYAAAAGCAHGAPGAPGVRAQAAHWLACPPAGDARLEHGKGNARLRHSLRREGIPRRQGQAAPRHHGLLDGWRSQHFHRLRPSRALRLCGGLQRLWLRQPAHRRSGEDQQELQDDLHRLRHRGHRRHRRPHHAPDTDRPPASSTSGARIPATATTTRSGASISTACCSRRSGIERSAQSPPLKQGQRRCAHFQSGWG